MHYLRLAAVGAAFVASSPPAVADVVNWTGRIFIPFSNKCLDVSQASRAEGAAVQQWSCHGGANQVWLVRHKGNGQHEIVLSNSDLCLDVQYASLANRAHLIQFRCHGGTNQRFLVDMVNGKLRIRAVHSSKCLDIEEGSIIDGKKLIQFDCRNQTNQRFLFR